MLILQYLLFHQQYIVYVLCQQMIKNYECIVSTCTALRILSVLEPAASSLPYKYSKKLQGKISISNVEVHKTVNQENLYNQQATFESNYL